MSNQLLSSKIAIIEEPPTSPAITGSATSDCAMVAITERGPIAGPPTLVNSFGQYSKIFGSFTADSDGALAAQMFFDEGGVNLWVSRTVHYSNPANPASATATTGSAVLNTATLTAQPAFVLAANAGPYALSAGQTLLAALNGGGPVTTTFTATAATVTGSNTAPFTLANGKTLNLSIDGEPTVAITFVTAEFVSIATATIAEVLAVVNAALSAAGSPAIATATGGGDGLAGLADADFVGNQAGPTGLYTFDQTQSIRLVIIPAQATPAIHNGMLAYCEAFRFGSCFAVLDPPLNMTAAEIDAYVVTTALLKESSEFGAIYWPNIQIANPNTSVFGTAAAIVVAPSGAIAGRYGANDAASPGGVYEAPAGMGTSPAGVGYGQLISALGLETNEVADESKRDLIYPDLINPIVGLTGLPIHMDGAKTLLSTGNFPTIGERRGIIYIEQSLDTGLVPFKHRKIKASTLAALGRAIKNFLTIQTNNGAFASDNPKQAFSVDTGAGINTPADAQALTMNGRIGVATAKPGEFIVLRGAGHEPASATACNAGRVRGRRVLLDVPPGSAVGDLQDRRMRHAKSGPDVARRLS